MTRRYALRDDQWERIQNLLPGREGTVGRKALDNRLFVEAVLYRYRAGIPNQRLTLIDSGTSALSIPVLVVGATQGYGKEYFKL